MKNSVLTTEALAFVLELDSLFERDRQELLLARSKRTTLAPKSDGAWEAPEWRTAAIPKALQKRTVEITGPAEAKMMINALNSGADVFMADLEDALSPTWDNVIDGQRALADAIRGVLSYQSPDGRTYNLNSKTAALVVRPRGWHLNEPRLRSANGKPMSGSLFDFGMFMFHNAREAAASGRGPFFYLPKLEGASEARLWSRVFAHTEEKLGLPHGTIKATVLIETFPAAMEMEGILFELRDYIIALNAGRWDYLFSAIKCLPLYDKENTLFPDRSELTMTTPFMRAYAERLVAVCHKRGAQAIGGMSAFVPSRKDEEANARAFAAVTADKTREASQGFDGTWVAHPDLVPIARAAFEATKPVPSTIGTFDGQTLFPRASHAPFNEKRPTLRGIDTNIDVTLRYVAAWLSGFGAVAIHGLMEDAATAEISRTQLWHWRTWRSASGAPVSVALESGETVPLTDALVNERIDRAFNLISKETVPSIAGGSLSMAVDLLRELVFANELAPFLTLPAMDRLPKPQSTQGAENVHTANV